MKFLCNETKSNSSEKNSDISFIMLPKTSKFIQSEISFFCIVFKQNNIYEFILIKNNHYYGDDYCVIDLFIIKNHSTDIEKKYFITIPSLKQIKRLKKSQHTIKTTFPYIFLYKSFFKDKALNLKSNSKSNSIMDDPRLNLF